MKNDRWKEIKQILNKVLEKTPQEREAFLGELCKSDVELKNEVIAFLAYDEKADSFLSSPIIESPVLSQKSIDSQINQQESAKELLKPRSLQEMLIKLIGEVLDDKYLIEKRLGQGGMGAVFKATHLGTERPVAIKVISPQFMANDEFIERFRREAKAAGRLSHPNVVNVTDFGFTKIGLDNIAYLVMEYLNGYTLGDLLQQKKKLPLEFVVDIIEQVCLAVELAHSQGIIHRDLKPDNIWLEPNGRGGYNVKVLDFGIAKLHNISKNIDPNKTFNDSKFDRENFSQIEKSKSVATLIKGQVNNVAKSFLTLAYGNSLALPPSLSAASTAIIEKRDTLGNETPYTEENWLTEVGTIVGTPTYMSPEQCQRLHLDARSDIYSLAVIVYKMLSGESPFKGDVYQVMFQHTNNAPPQLKEKYPKLSSAVADLVMSALAKDPEKRPISASAFAIALRTAMEGESPIIRQAIDIFRHNFVKVFRVSTIINLPIVLLSGILICFLEQNPNVYPGFEYIPVLWWLLPLVIIMISAGLNTLAFAPIIKQFHENKPIDIPIKQFLLNVVNNFFGIVITNGLSVLNTLANFVKFIIPGWKKHIEQSMSSCVVAIEELEGKTALERSRKLVAPLRALVVGLELRALTTIFTIFFLSFLPFCLDDVLDFSKMKNIGVDPEDFYVWAFILVILIPGMIAIFVQPVIAMSFLQIYFKSREILGEPANETTSLVRVENFISGRFAIKQRSKIVLASLMIIMMMLSSLSYTLFVPPAKIAELDLPKIEKIPDSENAWVDYKLALGQLVKTNMMSIMDPSELSSGNTTLSSDSASKVFKALQGYEDFYKEIVKTSILTEQQKSFLDSYKPIVEHLIAGSKKTKAQYYTEHGPYIKGIGLLPTLGITYIALAQAHRLMIEGKTEEAIDLVLAVYKMSTDLLAEPYAPMVHYLIGYMQYGRAIKILTIWMNGEYSKNIDYISLVKNIEILDSRLLSPVQMVENEYIDFATDVREVLVSNNTITDIYGNLWELEREFLIIKPFYGLRLRTYNYVIQKYNENTKQVLLYVKKNDFVSMKDYTKSLDSFLYYCWPPFIENFAAEGVFKMRANSYLADIKTFYQFGTISLAWKTFAVCLVYKQTHGQFPSNLEEAFANTGFKLPIDPVTNKPVGYRLEKNVPVIWFAGYDGVDNGGKVACTYETYGSNLVGQDWVFRFGEMPFLYRKAKKD